MEFVDLKDIHQTEPINGFKVKFAHSDNLTLAFWEIKANSILPDHSHVHEQMSIVTKGEFELTINEKTMTLRQGMVAVIQSNERHSAKAITDCEITDIFYPVREDYKLSLLE